MNSSKCELMNPVFCCAINIIELLPLTYFTYLLQHLRGLRHYLMLKTFRQRGQPIYLIFVTDDFPTPFLMLYGLRPWS